MWFMRGRFSYLLLSLIILIITLIKNWISPLRPISTLTLNRLCVGLKKGCEIVGGHMANDMLFDDFLTLATFRNLVFLRPARVN